MENIFYSYSYIYLYSKSLSNKSSTAFSVLSHSSNVLAATADDFGQLVPWQRPKCRRQSGRFFGSNPHFGQKSFSFVPTQPSALFLLTLTCAERIHARLCDNHF